MGNIEILNPEYLNSISDYIESFDTLVIDCNLSFESLEFLINRFNKMNIYVEGVSQSKVEKIKPFLKNIDLLKINNLELNTLLNKDNCDIIKSVKELIEYGLKAVIVSSSDEPITYNINEDVFQSSVEEPEKIVSTVGAGDALFSGIIKALNHGYNMHDAINYAKKVAAKTLESESACNKDISIFKDL